MEKKKHKLQTALHDSSMIFDLIINLVILL
jgi:hypothetical protein